MARFSAVIILSATILGGCGYSGSNNQNNAWNPPQQQTNQIPQPPQMPDFSKNRSQQSTTHCTPLPGGQTTCRTTSY